MTTAYMVAARYTAEPLAGVISPDRSCRPQMVDDDCPSRFAALLREVQRRTGIGALLNTSFNIHGEPLVCTPAEAVNVFRHCDADALVIGPALVPGRHLSTQSEAARPSAAVVA